MDAVRRTGAGQLDEAAYRASGGRAAQLDPAQARAAAARHLRAAGFTGQATITADTGRVTIGLAESIRTPIFNSVGVSPIRLAVHARAEPRLGTAQSLPLPSGTATAALWVAECQAVTGQ